MKGSCQCGSVTYEIQDDYIALVACYCTECQKMSTGVGGYSMVMSSESLQLNSGELKRWERLSESGDTNIAYFCPTCSNRIYNENPALPGLIRLKAGTLDCARELEPDAHLWMQSAPDWVCLPEGALSYQTQPGVEEGLAAINERRARAANKEH